MKSILPFLVRFSASFFAIFTNYIVAKHLTLHLYGVYSSMLSLTYLFNIFTDWGFNSFGSQMIAQLNSYSKRNLFITQAISFKILLSVIFSIVYLIFCFYTFERNSYLLFGLPIILFSFLNFEWITRGFLLPELSSYRQLLFSFLNIAIFYFIYYFKLPKYLMFIFYSFNVIFSHTYLYLIFAKKQRTTFLNKRLLRPKFEFVANTSLYFYGFLINNLNYLMGAVVLTFFSTPNNVGLYASFYNLFSTLVAPVVIAYSLFSPKFHLLTNEQYFSKYFKVISFLIVSGIIFYINGRFFYNLFYPNSFIFKSNINILMCGIFIMYCLENSVNINYILDRNPKKYFIVNVIGAIIGITSFSFLIIYKTLNVESALFTLLFIQLAMFLISMLEYKHLARYFKSKQTYMLLCAIIGLFCLSIFDVANITILILSGITLAIAGFFTFNELKNLY